MVILINICLTKSNFECIYDYVLENLFIEKELKDILLSLKEMFDKFPNKESFSIDSLQLYFFSNNSVREKDRSTYEAIFAQCRGLPVDEDIVEATVASLRTKAGAGKLALAAMAVAEGKEPVEHLRQFYEELDSVQEPTTDEDQFVTHDLDRLYDETVSAPGLRWRLEALNRSLGSLRKGDFGFIFARPETGKTTFLASEVSFFATQLGDSGKTILWFSNEEQGNKVALRCYQAALGKTLHELMSDRSGNAEEYAMLGGRNIRIYDSAAIHRSTVENLAKQANPGLIVFDQIDKIKGFEADREDLRLGQIYIWARELAKTYCPVIGVSQASGEAEGVKYLHMDHCANAKTSKQAEADWILGIGATHDPDYQHIRYLSICKNKLQGDEDTNPELRHGKLDVEIQPTVARYKDLLN